MKKILFAIMAVAAITFTACNGTAKGGAETDSIAAEPTTEVTTNVEDADATVSALSAAVAASDAEQTQTLLQKAQEYIAKLQAEGKIEEAKAYLAKIQQFIADNEEKIAEYTAGNEALANIVSAVKAIPVDAAAVAEGAQTAVEGAAADAAQKANEAANAAAQKANDAANAAADKAKEDAGKAIDKAAADVKGKLGL